MSGLLAMRHKIKLCDNFSGVVFETDNFLYQIHKPYTYKKIIGTSEKIELTEKVLGEF